jgi:alpha/beta superfamily hydrolase
LKFCFEIPHSLSGIDQSTMSQRFFGQPESPLFGVYHSARGRNQQNDSAVVICPPIGQEYIRTHWSLRLLANQLARGGAHVLRMDYLGIGDSASSVEQIGSLGVWQQNIEEAIEYLKAESGAQSVMLLGQRFGGTLAAQVAGQRDDVNSVVLWEPIINGQSYVDGLRAMHAQMIDLWVCKMETPNDERVEEILGSQYSRALLNEIEQTLLDVTEIRQPQLIVDVESAKSQYSHPVAGLQKVLIENNEGSWNDLKVMETARLRPVTTRKIVKTVSDMFVRLRRFEALAFTGDVNSPNFPVGSGA